MLDKDTVIALAKQCGHWSGETIEMNDVGIERFAALVAAHEHEECAYRAGIALLGADRGLANRVDQAIRSRT